MNQSLFTRLVICIAAFGFCLYSYIDAQNQVTRLRLEIPMVAKQIKDVKEKNTRLQYEIDLFESPEHLIELARSSEFAHLKHPMQRDILTMQQGLALQVPSFGKEDVADKQSKVKFAMAPGANN